MVDAEYCRVTQALRIGLRVCLFLGHFQGSIKEVIGWVVSGKHF